MPRSATLLSCRSSVVTLPFLLLLALVCLGARRGVDPAVEVAVCRALRRAPRSRSRRPRRRLCELDPGGQQDRPAEADLDGEGVGQAALERRQAARLRPHPVRDRRREAERLRGQRVHVDRVAVAGDGRVAAAEVAAEAPLGAAPAARRRDRGTASPSCARAELAACRGAATCWCSPRRLAADRDLGQQSRRCWPFGCGAQLGRAHAERQLLADPDPAVLGDPVLDVDQADRAEREAAVGHHRHVQREGEHVRVGGGQVVAQGEAADLGVGGEAAGSARTPASSSSRSGISPPPPGTKGSSEAPGIIGAAARA